MKGRPARIAAALSLRAADLVLATSEDTRLGLEAYRLNSVQTVPLGVDTALYQPTFSGRRSYLLTITHLTADNVSRKRILDVVRAVSAVPGLRAVIVGKKGNGADAVSDEVERLGVGDRIVLAGEVSPAEKRRLLSEAAVYVQPTEYEAFGMAIAEAMACGAPVISHAVGNVPALVGDTGLLMSRDAGSEELCDAIVAVMHDSRREQRARAARARIESTFSIDQRREAIRAALATVCDA